MECALIERGVRRDLSSGHVAGLEFSAWILHSA